MIQLNNFQFWTLGLFPIFPYFFSFPLMLILKKTQHFDLSPKERVPLQRIRHECFPGRHPTPNTQWEYRTISHLIFMFSTLHSFFQTVASSLFFFFPRHSFQMAPMMSRVQSYSSLHTPSAKHKVLPSAELTVLREQFVDHPFSLKYVPWKFLQMIYQSIKQSITKSLR